MSIGSNHKSWVCVKSAMCRPGSIKNSWRGPMQAFLAGKQEMCVWMNRNDAQEIHLKIHAVPLQKSVYLYVIYWLFYMHTIWRANVIHRNNNLLFFFTSIFSVSFIYKHTHTHTFSPRPLITNDFISLVMICTLGLYFCPFLTSFHDIVTSLESLSFVLCSVC